MNDRDDHEADARRLEVGYVAGAHGIHGAMRVHLHDAESSALGPGRAVWLGRGSELTEHEVRSLEDVPGKPQRRRLTLVDVRDRNQAEALRGCTLWVDRDELTPLADDEFYLADAIGRPVWRQHDGRALGEIVGLTSNGVQDLFEVQWRGPDGRRHEWLLPVLPGHIVDIDEQRVVVDLPLGMLPDALEPDAPPEREPDQQPGPETDES